MIYVLVMNIFFCGKAGPLECQKFWWGQAYILSMICLHCTEVSFASFLSGGFTTMAVMNPPEKKLEKSTSLH